MDRDMLIFVCLCGCTHPVKGLKTNITLITLPLYTVFVSESHSETALKLLAPQESI